MRCSADDLRARVDAEHDRHARAVDVRVQQTPRAPALRERDREVDRDGRLAHAALRARHRDDVAHPGDRRRAGSRRDRARGFARGRRRAVTCTVRTPGSEPTDTRTSRAIRCAISRPSGSPARSRSTVAVVHPHVRHHAERHDVAPVAREEDALQRVAISSSSDVRVPLRVRRSTRRAAARHLDACVDVAHPLADIS